MDMVFPVTVSGFVVGGCVGTGGTESQRDAFDEKICVIREKDSR